MFLLLPNKKHFACPREVIRVKQENKNKLAAFLLEQTGIQINPNSLFDVQAKTTLKELSSEI